MNKRKTPSHSSPCPAPRCSKPKKARASQIHVQRDYDDHLRTVERQAAENRSFGRSGSIVVTSLHGLSNPNLRAGYKQVWTHPKHGNQPGIECITLNPVRLHAMDHTEKMVKKWKTKVVDAATLPLSPSGTIVYPSGFQLEDLPPAFSIENYHQCTKVFAQELQPGTSNPCSTFWQLLQQGYEDGIPHIHPLPAAEIKHKSKNSPIFSLRTNDQGVWRRFSHVESRFFYCHMYEKRVARKAEFTFLQNQIARGYNLEVMGYDVYPVTESLWEHYLDSSRPFGHELVLYGMLTESDPHQRPWNRYRQENVYVYQDFVTSSSSSDHHRQSLPRTKSQTLQAVIQILDAWFPAAIIHEMVEYMDKMEWAHLLLLGLQETFMPGNNDQRHPFGVWFHGLLAQRSYASSRWTPPVADAHLLEFYDAALLEYFLSLSVEEQLEWVSDFRASEWSPSDDSHDDDTDAIFTILNNCDCKEDIANRLVALGYDKEIEACGPDLFDSMCECSFTNDMLRWFHVRVANYLFTLDKVTVINLISRLTQSLVWKERKWVAPMNEIQYMCLT